MRKITDLLKKKVKFSIKEKEKATPINVTLRLDKDIMIDEDAFAKALFIKVPNVVGMSIKDVVVLLNSKKINFKLVGKEVIPKEGSVYKQYPEAGEPLSLKDELQVYVNDNVSK